MCIRDRIQHIEERHPGDYEQFVKYVADILENPDYILEANKPNNGVILKEIEEKMCIRDRCGFIVIDKWISRLGKCRVFVSEKDGDS